MDLLRSGFNSLDQPRQVCVVVAGVARPGEPVPDGGRERSGTWQRSTQLGRCGVSVRWRVVPERRRPAPHEEKQRPGSHGRIEETLTCPRAPGKTATVVEIILGREQADCPASLAESATDHPLTGVDQSSHAEETRARSLWPRSFSFWFSGCAATACLVRSSRHDAAGVLPASTLVDRALQNPAASMPPRDNHACSSTGCL